MESTPGPRYRWVLRPADEAAVADLSAALGTAQGPLPTPLSRALVLRGITSVDAARRFFRPDLAGLHDPFLMKDMDRAADRLAAAVRAGERVLVYGDYDVDGTTATAVLTLFLRDQGLEPAFFIPNRFQHGYGLGVAGLDHAKALGATLVVALDCGITAVEEAAYARQIGLDLIIGDHHRPVETIPDAVAVLDPLRPDCAYPFDGLSGCGVGFKLVQATLDRLGRPPEEAYRYLDLVAVSIASDIVPIADENRILMNAGLELLGTAPRLGFRLLAERAGVDLTACTASKIVFQIGPRINAAGRLEDASLAVELMMEDDPARGAKLADALEALNQQRRLLDQQTRGEALALAAPMAESGALGLVLHHEGWHPGVIGITASRVAEQFHRPTVMLTSNGDGVAKGSARSVKGISVHAALERCADLLIRFGGHAFAAGLALPVEHVPAFRARFAEAIADVVASADALTPELEIDAELDLTDVTGRFWRVHEQLRPFGPENLRPVFWGRDLRVVGAPATCGAAGQHLRMRVAQRAGGPPFSLIGFGLGEHLETVLRSARRGLPLEVAFSLDENTWNGRTSLQLNAQDVRIQGEGATPDA